MQPYIRPSPSPAGGILASAGGLITLAANFLPWYSVDLGNFFGVELPGFSTNGFTGILGIVRAVLALAALVLGILAAALPIHSGRRGVSIALIASGGLLFLLVLIGLFQALGVSPEVGVFVALVASALVPAGGVMALVDARKLGAEAVGHLAVPPPPPPPET